MTRLGCVVAAIVSSTAVARAEPAAIMVLAADNAPIDPAFTAAIVRGAQRVSPAVTAGSASLADTAFIAGCDPAVPACLDAVSSQLGVGQLVIVSPRKHGGQIIVDVAASRPGGAPRRRSFAIGADPGPSLAELEDAIPTLLGAAPTRPTVATPITATGTVAETRRPRGALIVTIGGGVLAGAGLALWAMASSTQRDIDDAPTTTPGDLERLADLERTGRTYAGVGNGLVIAGAVAAAAGLGWLWWDRRQRRDRALRITPVATAQRVGLALEGSW